jgi:hypothetical protein
MKDNGKSYLVEEDIGNILCLKLEYGIETRNELIKNGHRLILKLLICEVFYESFIV